MNNDIQKIIDYVDIHYNYVKPFKYSDINNTIGMYMLYTNGIKESLKQFKNIKHINISKSSSYKNKLVLIQYIPNKN